MREVSGSTWVFQLMIIFILIFACFLCLVINYSKAYRVKNEVLSIIEKYEGMNSTSQGIINNYMRGESYLTVGGCPDGWYGASINSDNIEEARPNQKYSYCFTDSYTSDGLIYYNLIVFYKFNLPFLGDIMTFEVEGTTESFQGSLDRY